MADIVPSYVSKLACSMTFRKASRKLSTYRRRLIATLKSDGSPGVAACALVIR